MQPGCSVSIGIRKVIYNCSIFMVLINEAKNVYLHIYRYNYMRPILYVDVKPCMTDASPFTI